MKMNSQVIKAALKIEALIGKRASDYNGSEGVIVDACHVSQWESLCKWDESGWMSDDLIFGEEFEGIEALVAFKADDDDEYAVFTFENGGVDLV
jgi:hypothetical protein